MKTNITYLSTKNENTGAIVAPGFSAKATALEELGQSEEKNSLMALSSRPSRYRTGDRDMTSHGLSVTSVTNFILLPPVKHSTTLI